MLCLVGAWASLTSNLSVMIQTTRDRDLERIILILDLTSSQGGARDICYEALYRKAINAISAVSQLDTAWLRLLIEFPSIVQTQFPKSLSTVIEDSFWINASFVDEKSRVSNRLELIEDFEATGLGFISGNEFLPKEAVFKWSKARSYLQMIIDNQGVALACLPGATIISDQRVLENIHYSGVLSATVAFFQEKHILEVLSIDRSEWFSKYTSMSCFGAGHVLVATPDDCFLEHFSNEKSIKPLSPDHLVNILAKFEVSEDDFYMRLEAS